MGTLGKFRKQLFNVWLDVVSITGCGQLGDGTAAAAVAADGAALRVILREWRGDETLRHRLPLLLLSLLLSISLFLLR